jgi:hypothetical protein
VSPEGAITTAPPTRRGHLHLAERPAPARHEGFREYYDPRQGRGLGVGGFGWSTLIVDLLLPG